MELFIPTLTVLGFAAIVCFFVLPRLSMYMLGLLSVAMLAYGVWQNYTMFPNEYSALSGVIQDFSGYALVLVVIGVGIMGINFVHPGALPDPMSIIPTASLPSLPSFTSSNSSVFNLGGTSSSSFDPVATVTNALKTPITSPFNTSRRGLASTSFGIV